MNKRKAALVVMIILVAAGFSMYLGSHTLYGNDQESIVRVIQSIEGYEDKPIEILRITDFKDVRIVGFLYNDWPAQITFYKNSTGNYKWQSIEVRQGETVSTFFPILPDSIRPKLMYVSSGENKTTVTQVDVNGQMIEQEVPPNKASVIWVDLPQTGGNY
ncbi:hypothetical protein [Domibacillus indicus]|uniref:hypothetical protein n=1 Tax=Domibacillus indicus TaxID=1437523 RepID=UPI000AC1C228|nr:hypothetical protein [Domibacillus indicus]